MTMANNYVRGSGKIFFDRFAAGTETRTGELYLGNTPSFSLTIAAEKLEHFSADRGLREKDASVVIETTRSGTMSCDNISTDNVALFFFGTASNVTQTAIAGPATETISMRRGRFYQIGQTAARPTGLRNVTVTSVATTTPAATAVLGTDYVVDSTLGRIEILANSPFFSTEKSCVVTYSAAAATFERVISGATPVLGALRFIADNPIGANRDFYMPKVEITPSGEYALKGEDWQTIEFALEVLKPDVGEAIYADGRPL
jgi:hypothetical protein